MAFALAQAPARARDVPLTVLVAPTIDDGALGAIVPLAWSKYVTGWIGRSFRVIAFTDPSGDPTLEECRKAGADYIVAARFARRPRLPGLALEDGRIAAQARLHVVDCVTGASRSDAVVALEGDPVESAVGDAEPTQDSRWDREVPAALAKVTLDLQRPARVLFVRSPLARIKIADRSLKPGDVLRDVSTAQNTPREQPIVLTVTQVYDDGVDALFDANAGTPQPGDYVER
jgi:hypothetical protein